MPRWLENYEWSLRNQEFVTDEQMMQVAIEISKQNVAHQTGGPFGCAIFEKDTSTGIAKLFSVGANRVTILNNSTLHGETVAIQFAQKKLRTYSMRQVSNDKEYIMCTSCEPCAMCLGATLWSGVHEIICSAAKEDAESIGFNEGPVFDESYRQLEQSGIKVKRKILQAQGAQILQEYGKTGLIYNG